MGVNFSLRRGLWLMGAPLALSGLLAACQGKAEPVPVASARAQPAAVARTETSPPALSDAGFAVWLDAAREDAAKRGIAPATISQALGGLTLNQRIIEADGRQPEFSNTFTRYLNSLVSERRVANGRAMMQQHAPLLARLEREYGVPARFLVAFWGMESDYGRDAGAYPVVQSLATLAFEGRRGDMFRNELFNALTILDRGHITLDKMTGSYAGAMGQTQFMPSTFLRYAVDEDKNGHIDIWSSVPDALGSSANYVVKALGWNTERTWGREVRLPKDFDLKLVSLDVDAKETMKSLAEWSALGVRRVDGKLLPAQDIQASVVLPAGRNGPALLLYDNYRVILKYNRSAFYAISIGHLADRLIGAGGLNNPGAEGDPLRREEVVGLQEALVTLGFLKIADGVMGSGTRQAIRAFQLANGLVPDGYADRNVIAAVRAKAARS